MSRRALNRVRTLLLSGCAIVALSPALAAAQTANPVRFSIPEQDLSVSLNQFAHQSNRSIVFSTDAAIGRRAPAIQGDLPPERALAMLLEGSGLSFRREGDAFLVVKGGSSGPQAGSAAGDGAEVEELVVTAQKKEENIQDVPIAISAFTQKSLDAQKIEGGFDLLKAIPNVTFSKNNFTGYNFSIRGVGTKAISATTDPGVAVSFNNTTLIVNRLFEQEYFDVERVEVLRGPQGTLYGRNATSGVINVLSARPKFGDFEGDLKLEGGNYNARRARGMVNIPIGDTLAIRLAGALTKRDGYGINEAADDPEATQEVQRDVDDRDLWSARLTIGWEPVPELRVNALWERFEEDDRRARTSKQLCHRDPGPQTLGDFNWDDWGGGYPAPLARALTSQGCQPGSLYDDAAYGTPNGASMPYILGLYWGPRIGGDELFSDLQGRPILGYGYNPYHDFRTGFLAPFMPAPQSDPPCEAATLTRNLLPIDVCSPDPYGGRMQTQDLRSIYSLIEPVYRAKADIFELSLDFDLTASLTLTSQTVFVQDEVYASQDFNRFTTLPIFTDSTSACGQGFVEPFPGFQIPAPDCSPEGRGTWLDGLYADMAPGGVFTDPQLGPSRTLVGQDLSMATSEQFNQEIRLVSNFDGALNFSLGANFTSFETQNDYFVFINALTMISNFFPFGGPCQDGTAAICKGFYVDESPGGIAGVDGEGHNYFRSANPYELTSSAVFGEVYWQATDTLKVTLGARMTWDQKIFTPVPSQTLLGDYRVAEGYTPGDGPELCSNPIACPLSGTAVGGKGYPANPDIVQEWREPTGRLIVDWKPDLGFTDETMIYASVAHGYKGGGANPPGIAAPSGLYNTRNSGGVAAPPTFEPEFINAYELGSKNVLFGGGLILNGSLFHYDYKDYQVSKIVDRSAANENFDAKIWGAELEWVFSPTRNLRFNGTLGYLKTEIAEGERSLDLMDRTQGGGANFWIDANGVRHELAFDQWVVLKPWIVSSSNCVAPLAAVEALTSALSNRVDGIATQLFGLCPGGGVTGDDYRAGAGIPGLGTYDPDTQAPNGGAGFLDELGGNELPNAPHWTASIGAQYRFALPAGWDGTARVDHYWQDESFARVYNTEYDRLHSWQNTNFSLWVENPDWGVTAEVYVKNAFDEEPITDAFLNSDDTGLTTNVFTLDPRLVGVSVRKQF